MAVAQIDPTELANAREAVARGVALLDERVPEWRARIKKATFDIADGSVCVLGQTFAQKFKELEEDEEGTYLMNGYDLGTNELGIDGSDYGFDAYDGDYVYNEFDDTEELVGGYQFPALARAWEEELWPEMFMVTFDGVNALLDERFAEFRNELPGLISGSLREVFRRL